MDADYWKARDERAESALRDYAAALERLKEWAGTTEASKS